VKGNHSATIKPDAPVNPQWDRFGFTIDLSDYARSRSLVNRTLWFVIRFAVPGPVRVPVPVTLMSRSTSSQALQDVLSPSDSEMLSTLISGVAGAPHYDESAQLRYARGRDNVEDLLRRKNVCVGVGVGTEWWDNNGTQNFKVGFKEVQVAVGGVEVVEEKVEVDLTVTYLQEQKDVKKRVPVVSCPRECYVYYPHAIC